MARITLGSRHMRAAAPNAALKRSRTNAQSSRDIARVRSLSRRERSFRRINKALQAPAVVQAFQEGGIAPLAGSPERFAAFIRSETDKYAQVIRKAGITAES